MRVLGPVGRWAAERVGRAVPALVAAAVAAALAGCTDPDASAGEEPVLGSETTLVAATDGEQAAGRDAHRGSGSAPGGGASSDAAVAEVLDQVVGGIEPAPPGMEDFFDDATDERIDELATTLCERMTAELSPAELAAITTDGWEDLTPAERALIDLGAYRVAIGVMAGVYCPERLPLAADILLAGADLGDLDAYRNAVPSLLGADHAAVGFVDALTDRRLDRLQDRACAALARAPSIAGLGVIVLDQYEGTLTSRERDAIGFADYLDLVGSMLTWFCPERIAPPLRS